MRQQILQSRFQSVYPTYPALAARNVREAIAAQEAMDREMENLKSHNVYELMPRTNSNAPSNLDGYFTGSPKNGLFDRNKGRLVGRGSHQRPGID